jgi:D-3-phosphoglycerate dehydrogenase
VTACALAGFLDRWQEQTVNQVSARHLAADRGIAVRELRATAPQGKYATLVVVRTHDASGAHAVEGTLGSDGSARLVKWGSFEIEAVLGGQTMVVTSIDTPGVIGYIGTTLGNAGINVARVHLGLTDGRAISVWNLDQPLPAALLEQLRRSPHVETAVTVQI